MTHKLTKSRHQGTTSQNSTISVIVPFFNERDTIESLVDALVAELEGLDIEFEILLVDDGSTDDGASIARAVVEKEPCVRLIQFTRNFGKASALSAGFTKAIGDIIITMDADLQDEPTEIRRFIRKIEEGFDVVSGWKKTRKDSVGKRFSSRIFNWLVQASFGIGVHDINCGYKAYSRRAADSLNIYGELHRFTPVLAYAKGYTVTEIVIDHHPREFGESKYGFTRMFKGFLDLITVKLITQYRARPLHFFGLIALPIGAIGFGMITYLTILWFAGLGPIGNRPLLLIGILFVITATQLLGIGLTAELILTTRMGEQNKYVIEAEHKSLADSN